MLDNQVKKPLLRGHSHQVMFFVSVGASLMLIAQANSAKILISFIIYSFGVLSMFGVSALYHRIDWSPQKRALFRKLDHSAIYLMIAGTFTPVAVIGLSDQSMKVLLWTIWLLAVIGIVKSIWLTNLPKFLNAILYLAAGYVVFPYLGELSDTLGLLPIVLLAIGGMIYSVGAVIYGMKRPNPSPLYFGYHEVFHILVIIAAILHFIMIYLIFGNQV